MNKKTLKQMAKMVDAVQPSCDEEIIAAITCSHAGSIGSVLSSKLIGGVGVSSNTNNLPNPVFIAVGANTVYAFNYSPRGFKFKINNEVARWSKADISVIAEKTNSIVTFVMTTVSGENYPLEIPVVFGGKDLADMFLNALGGSQ